MRILINLSNLLLGEALGSLLVGEGGEYRVEATKNPDEVGDFSPDTIVVDAVSIRHDHTSRWPSAKIILIDTGLKEEEIVNLLLSYRLDGVIRTDTDLPLFKKALETIHQGQIWLDNGRIRSILNHAESLVNMHQENGFSRREREIVILVSQGRRNREIAGMLRISEQTVKTHMSRIFRKANLTSRSQLVPLALKLKLT